MQLKNLKNLKVCNKCNEELGLNMFYIDKSKKDGLQSNCKSCIKIINKTYNFLNPNKSQEYNLKFKNNNPNYYEGYNKQYNLDNYESQKEYNKLYKSSDIYKIQSSKYSHKWRLKNPNYGNEWCKNRKKNDPIFKLSHSIRNLILGSFKRACNGKFNKSQHTQEILGCTLEEFIQHLESQFVEGMALENHGEWEIDHIIPISSGKTEEEILKLNYYTNFQPLWKEDNRKKFNKY
jgi:hypothetical protein